MSIRYLFNTAGDYVAFQKDANVFTPEVDWLGFVLGGNQLFSTDGKFIGYILDDDRVARNKAEPPKTPICARPLPLKPLKPLRPLKRLRKPKLLYPYEDVFEHGIVGIEPGSLGPDVSVHALDGSQLFAADNAFLGNVNKDPFDINALSNQFGPYGNPFSADSIFNEYATYGNPYSVLSPYNEFSRTPPYFKKGDSIIAYLTVNQFISPRVDPNAFRKWLGV